jgi:hypothetical protein
MMDLGIRWVGSGFDDDDGKYGRFQRLLRI